MDDIKSLEHATLKVPYEVLNKKFRVAQKNIDREVAHVQSSTTDLEKCLQKKESVQNVAKVLSGMVEKLKVLKRKAEESIKDEVEAAQACKRRLEHLKEFETLSPSAAVQWRKKRLDRMLVENFLRAGYYNTALKLAKHSEIEDLTNIDLFLVSKEVEESLEQQETAKCLSWCHDNRSKLRKMKSSLEFNLRQQEFIELIRNNKRLEAVRHARKYFTNLEEAQLFDVQRVMGLLAFSSSTTIIPYKDLLDVSRWQSLVQQFRFENFKLHQLNSQSIFSVTLQSGLSALKTPHCYKNSPDYKKADCPVCTKHLNQLARPLPSAHCAQSRLVCFISGEPLNEHNPPMMLPNGYVYGYNSLVQMAGDNEGTLVCPRTEDIYSFDEAEKVFVM
ncbi:unnamed protein product [Owenia fusiformis]|uniref:E3 ubiquitin-protein transferase MAEA n=1 Tax=Owenia fusiformis TaxID=6347 RepID=A0A8S4NNC5_OWEFU|nr:unnamed protein product [Owenia fusiformis]